MSEKIGCLQRSDAIEIGEAAKGYDENFCTACPHNYTCKVLNNQGGSDEGRRDSQTAT